LCSKYLITYFTLATREDYYLGTYAFLDVALCRVFRLLGLTTFQTGEGNAYFLVMVLGVLLSDVDEKYAVSRASLQMSQERGSMGNYIVKQSSKSLVEGVTPI